MSSLNGHMFLFSVQLIVSCWVVHFQNRQALMMAAVVMILRVWAIYNRSTLILGVLITSFSLEIIANILFAAVISNPTNFSGTSIPAEHLMSCTNKPSIMTPLVCRSTVIIAQIPGYLSCTIQPIPLIWMEVAGVLQITHGVAVCVLGIVQLVIRSLQMYRVTR